MEAHVGLCISLSVQILSWGTNTFLFKINVQKCTHYKSYQKNTFVSEFENVLVTGLCVFCINDSSTGATWTKPDGHVSQAWFMKIHRASLSTNGRKTYDRLYKEPQNQSLNYLHLISPLRIVQISSSKT